MTENINHLPHEVIANDDTVQYLTRPLLDKIRANRERVAREKGKSYPQIIGYQRPNRANNPNSRQTFKEVG